MQGNLDTFWRRCYVWFHTFWCFILRFGMIHIPRSEEICRYKRQKHQKIGRDGLQVSLAQVVYCIYATHETRLTGWFFCQPKGFSRLPTLWNWRWKLTDHQYECFSSLINYEQNEHALISELILCLPLRRMKISSFACWSLFAFSG